MIQFLMETLDNLPIPNIIFFFTVFLVIYLIGYFIVFRNWSYKIRPEASSCFVSLFHGTPAVFLAVLALFYDQPLNQQHGFSSINTKFQSLVLDYSISYFVMDLCHYLIFFPSDILFIAHHLATLYVFATCRYVVFHGAYAILILLILAEVTSLCQNVWTLAAGRKSDSIVAAKVYDLLTPPFYVFYSIVRGFVGPWFVYQMSVFYASGLADHVIPRYIWVSWLVVVVGAIAGSILWILNLWIEFYRIRIRKAEKKVT